MRKMSKSAPNNYVGVTEPPQEMFGKADVAFRRDDAAFIPELLTDAELEEISRYQEVARFIRWRARSGCPA